MRCRAVSFQTWDDCFSKVRDMEGIYLMNAALWHADKNYYNKTK